MWNEILLAIKVLGVSTIWFLILWLLLMPSTGIKKIKIMIGYCLGVMLFGFLIGVGRIVLELLSNKLAYSDIPDVLFSIFYLLICLGCGLSILAGYRSYIIPKSNNIDVEDLLHNRRKKNRIYLPLFIVTYIFISLGALTFTTYHEPFRFPFRWYEKMLNELSIISVLGILVLAFIGGLLLIHYNKYKELYSLYQGALSDSEEIIESFEQNLNIPEEMQKDISGHKKALQDLFKLDLYWASDIPYKAFKKKK